MSIHPRILVPTILLLIANASYADVTLTATQVQASLESSEAQSVNDFRGLSLGVGLGLSIDRGRGRVIQKAEVIGDTVRVLEEKTSVPRLLLESHYFFVSHSHDHFGAGPFVAIQSGSNEVIEAIGMGLMLGLRRARVAATIQTEQSKDDKAKNDVKTGATKVDTDSFNIGIGAVLDNRVQVLRAGVAENKPAPNGTTSLTKETSHWGWILGFSFTF
jgi:hypothetical protein